MRGKGASALTEDDYYDEEDDYYEEYDEEPADDWEDEYDDHVAGKKAPAKVRATAPPPLVAAGCCCRRRLCAAHARPPARLPHCASHANTAVPSFWRQQQPTHAQAAAKPKAPAAAAGASSMARGLCDPPPPRPSGKPQLGGKGHARARRATLLHACALKPSVWQPRR